MTVVLAAVSSALINELHGGWSWWLAAGAVVLLGALLSAWLALRRPAGGSGDVLGAGALKAGRDIYGDVETHTSGTFPTHDPAPADGDQLGPGAIKAGRDIHGDVKTTSTAPPQQPDS